MVQHWHPCKLIPEKRKSLWPKHVSTRLLAALLRQPKLEETRICHKRGVATQAVVHARHGTLLSNKKGLSC